MTPYLLYDTPVKNKEDSVKIALWNFNGVFFVEYSEVLLKKTMGLSCGTVAHID